MYLIVGLGNPGKKYEMTRHNMGYDVVDGIVNNLSLNYKEEKKAMFTKCKMYGEDVIIIKPLTYMNLSGEAVYEYMRYYKIPEQKIIVIYDEKDLEPGNIRIRKNGSSAGHNGIKDILKYTDKFIRVRIGIGRPNNPDYMIDHVIGKLSENEYEKLYEGVKKAQKAVIDIIHYGIDIAMNKNNIKSKTKAKSENQKILKEELKNTKKEIK